MIKLILLLCIMQLCCMDKESSYEQLLENARDNKLSMATQDNNGRTLLHRAIIKQMSLEFIDSLLKAWNEYNGFELSGDGLNIQDNFQRTALHYAVIYSSDDIIHKLIAQDQRNNKQDEQKQDQVDFTFDCVVDVDIPDIDGKTSIHWAMLKQRDPKILEALVSKSQALSARDSSGHSALHKAALQRFMPGVKVLVEHGESCNVPDKQGKAPLLYTLEHCSGAIKELVRLGADPNLQDADGNTPLHRAVLNRQPAWIRDFICAGACKAIKNNDGKTPYDLAVGEDRKFLENY